MSNALLLNIVLFLPLLPVLIFMLAPAKCEQRAKYVSLVFTLLHFLIALPLYFAFDSSVVGLQFETLLPWIPAWGVNYHIGLDALNILLVFLTLFFGPLVVLASFNSIKLNQRWFYGMVFLIQFMMMGAFLTQNLFVFYLFWEAMLIPMFFMIGIWGGEFRKAAAVKFFLYTAFGSILMLAAIISLLYYNFSQKGIIDLEFTALYGSALPINLELILFLAFALSFAIKVPMIPLHTWLPDAHVEAPTPGSVILAAILLKMGTYGFMKLAFPIFPNAVAYFTPAMMFLAVLSIVMGALLAYVQKDIKKIVAYSSISHLGYVMLGILALNGKGYNGAIIQMVGHGLTAGGLFLMIGMIYERCHTRTLDSFGGLAKVLPVYSVFFMIITLASVAVPGTSGFTGEFMILLGSFEKNYLSGNTFTLALSVIAVTGVILSALYMLWFAEKFLYGASKAPHLEELKDLSFRERAVLIPIVIMIFVIGLYPAPFIAKVDAGAKAYIQMSLPKTGANK